MNFYEYLSGSGSFNIDEIAADVWNLYDRQYNTASNEDLPFIQSKLHNNEDLVFMIDQLYQQLHQETGTIEKPEPNHQLLNPSIKMSLLGRAFSGRRTVAKQMQELLGPDVSILHIDEIIKEAMDYIAPKEVEEAQAKVDPKAKGKGKAKDEPVVTDIFEGKNTTAYKEIAQKIKD